MQRPSEKREQAPALQNCSTGMGPDRCAPISQVSNLRSWPHGPAHYLQDAGTYIVTAGTYNHAPFFRGAERLTRLTNCVLELAERYGWSLQAWAVFPNHYHLVGNSQVPESLRCFLRHLHSATAIQANKLDATAGRRVVVRVLGDATHISSVIFVPFELRPSECGPARLGAVRCTISLVLCRMVREEGHALLLSDGLWL